MKIFLRVVARLRRVTPVRKGVARLGAAGVGAPGYNKSAARTFQACCASRIRAVS